MGISGLILNLLFLFIFTEFFGIYYLISAIFSFSISMTHNYFFNKIWTFGESFGGDVIKKYFKFVGISLFALVINLFVMFILVEKFSIWYIFSQMIAISFASIFNFVGNKLWTFNDSK